MAAYLPARAGTTAPRITDPPRSVRAARTQREKDGSMNRFVRIPIMVMTCVVWAGLGLAQTSAPTAPPPAAGQTAGRGAAPGGFVPTPVVIGPPAPVPPEVA